MMKVLVLFSILICICSCATITWVGGMQGNNFAVAANWDTNNVPGSNDIAIIENGQTVYFNSSNPITVQQLTISLSSVLVIQSSPGTSTFNAGNCSINIATIYVASGCSFLVSGYANIDGTATFQNYGTTQFNPRFRQGTITNTGTQNIVFPGTLPTVVNFDTTIPATGFSFANVAHTFYCESLASATLTFNYKETVAGWTLTNTNNPNVVNFAFPKGVFLNGPISANGGPSTNAVSSVTFGGTINVGGTQTLTINANPSFVDSVGVYVQQTGGAKLAFQDKSVTYNTPVFGGNTDISFSASGSNNFAVTVNGQSVVNTNPGITYIGSSWTFQSASSFSYVWNVTNYNFNQNWTLNTGMIVNFPSTISSGFNLLGTSSITFFDGLNAQTSYLFNTTITNLKCNLPARTFALTGTGSVTFNQGLQVTGCTVTTTNAFTIQTVLITNDPVYNTTIPANTIFSNNMTFTNGVADTFKSITIPGTYSLQQGNFWTIGGNANFIEVITGALTLGVNSTIKQGPGEGILSVNGNISFNTGSEINSNLGFYNQVYTFTNNGNSFLTIGRILILRNSYLTGNAEIYFKGQTVALNNGPSFIDNPNFRFKNGLTTSFNDGGINPLVPGKLWINGTTTGQRTIEGGVSSVTNAQIIFSDSVSFNTSATVTGGGSMPNGGVVFLASLTRLENNAALTLNSNIYLNNTNNLWYGAGTFTVSNGANIILLGNWNAASQGVSSAVMFGTSVTLTASASATLGQNIFLDNTGTINTADVDGNSNVASTTLTFEGNRRFSSLTFGANLVVQGNLTINSGVTYTPPGTLTVGGNQLSLLNSPTFSNTLIFSQATTIIAPAAAQSLTLNENSAFNLFTQTLPVLNIVSPATLILARATSNFVVTTNGAISGSGSLITNGVTLSSSAATPITTASQQYQTTTFTGVGFTLTPTNNLITFIQTIISFTTTTVNAAFIQGSGAGETISGLTFTNNPLTFGGSSGFQFNDVRTISANWIANSNLIFNNDVILTNSGSFSGASTLSFYTSLTLGANLQISTNPVVFGSGALNNFVIIAGTGFTLTLTNRDTTVVTRVASGGASIVSTSPSGYLARINGAANAVIPPEWTWSNTVILGQLNVTGARVVNFPIVIRDGVTTIFTEGLTFQNTGILTYENTASSSTVRIEGSLTTNNNAVLPNQIDVIVSGPSFAFLGTNVLQLNGTFTCQTRISFNTSVTFGYAGTSNNINIEDNCFFLNSATTLTINRPTVQINSNNNLALFAENPIVFGLLPGQSTSLTSSGSTTFLWKGNFVIAGTQFTMGGTHFLGAISITTQQNATLNGLNPNSTLTFISQTTPSWVEPEVTFANNLVQVITLNGPIRLVNPTLGVGANFIGTGSNRVAFVNGLSLSASTTYNFGAPVQFFVTNPSTTFTLGLSSSSLILNSLPSTFNRFGFGPASFSVTGSGTLRTLYTGSLTTGDITLAGTVTLRLSSGSLTAGTLRVPSTATLWVDTATLTTTNLIFTTTGSLPSQNSNFQFTISSTNPTAVNSNYTFYAGFATVNVVNFNWNGDAFTAINSNTANSQNGVGSSGLFNSLTASPGYTPTQTRQNNNMRISATLNPTISPSPTQSNGPSPAVSSSPVVFFNFALFIILIVSFL